MTGDFKAMVKQLIQMATNIGAALSYQRGDF